MDREYYSDSRFLENYSPSIPRMLEAGVHYGHPTRMWNPKMRQYIYGERDGRYLFDLSFTCFALNRACQFLRSMAKENKNIVFVGTKRKTVDAIEFHAKRSGSHFVNRRWLGGMLTNYGTMRLRISRLRELEQSIESGDFHRFAKKEQAALYRQYLKLSNSLGGLKNLRGRPDVICVVDPGKEKTAILEAQKIGIKTVAIVDTDCDPTGIDYVVPGNDDSMKSVGLLLSCFADAIIGEDQTDDGDDLSPSGVPVRPVLTF